MSIIKRGLALANEVHFNFLVSRSPIPHFANVVELHLVILKQASKTGNKTDILLSHELDFCTCAWRHGLYLYSKNHRCLVI